MDEIEIKTYLQGNKVTKDYFINVLSYEELAADNGFISSRPGFYVANTGRVGTAGKHWVVLFKARGRKTIEFFDSLAKHPSEYSIKITEFIKQNGKSLLKSNKRIQGDGDVCGFFCLLYCYFRCKGKSMEYFLNLFSDDLNCNDDMVRF